MGSLKVSPAWRCTGYLLLPQRVSSKGHDRSPILTSLKRPAPTLTRQPCLERSWSYLRECTVPCSCLCTMQLPVYHAAACVLYRVPSWFGCLICSEDVLYVFVRRYILMCPVADLLGRRIAYRCQLRPTVCSKLCGANSVPPIACSSPVMDAADSCF